MLPVQLKEHFRIIVDKQGAENDQLGNLCKIFILRSRKAVFDPPTLVLLSC